jgi:hypothetical protein
MPKSPFFDFTIVALVLRVVSGLNGSKNEMYRTLGHFASLGHSASSRTYPKPPGAGCTAL